MYLVNAHNASSIPLNSRWSHCNGDNIIWIIVFGEYGVRAERTNLVCKIPVWSWFLSHGFIIQYGDEIRLVKKLESEKLERERAVSGANVSKPLNSESKSL